MPGLFKGAVEVPLHQCILNGRINAVCIRSTPLVFIGQDQIISVDRLGIHSANVIIVITIIIIVVVSRMTTMMMMLVLTGRGRCAGCGRMASREVV